MDVCAHCGYDGCMNKKFSIILSEEFRTRMVCVLIIHAVSKLFKSCTPNMSNCCFSQTIRCRARRDFLEHVNVAINDHRTFEVTLVKMTVPSRT